MRFVNYESFENFQKWNRDAIQKVTINMKLIGSTTPNSQQNVCVLPKTTYLTTGIMKNVFSVTSLSLNIFPVNDDATLTPILGQASGITLFLYRTLYIQYFNQISITGVNIQPAIDSNILKTAAGLNPNPNFVNQAFGIILEYN